MVKCEECGRPAVDVTDREMTPWDRLTIGHAAHARHPVGFVVLGLSAIAKTVFSKVYRCTPCDRVWREWFE